MEFSEIKSILISAILFAFAVGTYYFKKKSNKEKTVKNLTENNTSNNSQTNTEQNGSGFIISGNSNNVSIHPQSNQEDEVMNNRSLTNDEIRDKKSILFIDDQPYKMETLLKRNGWKNVKLIIDINRIDDIDVLNADVVLVDIVGVGGAMGFQDQGLGLADALKDEYLDTKKIIIYSQEEKGDRFNPILSKVDKCVKKSITVYQLEKILLDFWR